MFESIRDRSITAYHKEGLTDVRHSNLTVPNKENIVSQLEQPRLGRRFDSYAFFS